VCDKNVFARIVGGELQADIVYQDNLVTAFRDNNPQAPTHVLIVPNAMIPTTDHVLAEHEPALGRMFTAARAITKQEKLDKGYRLLINCKEHAGQEVYHLHMHLIGGCPLGPIILPSL
jgi:histidine triad (HIT) family protein